MDIYLVRASLAEGEATQIPEAQRFLSLTGRQLVRAVGTKLRADAIDFDRFVTAATPLSVQTAELFAERVDYLGAIEVLPSLQGSVPPQIIAPLILARGTSVVVVADEPLLSTLGALLAGRPSFPVTTHAQVSLIQGGSPAWYLRPDMISRAPLLLA